jgi:Ca-activated chloride channel family protein
MEKRKGISKGEVVVIIAILGILGAILLPAFFRARHGARRSACVNNLKEMGMILNLYATENRDRLPPIDDTKNNFMFEAECLYPEYLRDVSLLTCPADKAVDAGKVFRLTSTGKHPKFSVGEIHHDCITDASYNYFGLVIFNDADAETFFKLYDDLSTPSQGQLSYSLSGYPGGGSPAIPLLWDRPSRDPEGYNHRPAGGNVLYLNGMVEYKRYPEEYPFTEFAAKSLEERKRSPIPDCDEGAGKRREVVRRFDQGTQSRLGISHGVDRFFITDINTIFTGDEAGGYGPAAEKPYLKAVQAEPSAAALASDAPPMAPDWTIPELSDELLIIEQGGIVGTVDDFVTEYRRKNARDGTPQARLVTQIDDAEVIVPLEHTDVNGKVSAFVATVDVKQRFHNPYNTKIEADYVFPLPQNAAVTDFLMQVGERRIRGMIREREEAKRIYEEAREAGYVASLLTQERPNIFREKVANIEPGETIDINISYFGPLRYQKGEYEFVFPMVVGPRFNPPGSTEGVGAVARGQYGISGQTTEVHYLGPGERSGHTISLALDVDAGVEIEEVRSTSHAIDVERVNSTSVRVALSPNDRIPNRDFVLRYKVAGDRLKTAMLAHRGDDGGTFALVLQPPDNLADLPKMPREMIFVVDCSGSMSGRPIRKAKEAMRRCLRKLDPNDTFQIIRFSDTASTFGPAPVPATPANVRKGLRYVRWLRASGGTMAINGINQALDFPHSSERMRIVSFMTDGYIGNENEIFATIKRKVGSARIFSFGVGNSVNRHLLEGMARLGRGAVAYVGLDDSAGKEIDLFYERAARPALVDIEINWEGMQVAELYPQHIPDLFVGRPILMTGRFQGELPAKVIVRGRAGTEELAYFVDINDDEVHPGIESVWARCKITELSDREAYAPSEQLRREITETSLAYRLLCKYTAFVAKDESRITEGEYGVSISVPVPVPDGVKYETTVQES